MQLFRTRGRRSSWGYVLALTAIISAFIGGAAQAQTPKAADQPYVRWQLVGVGPDGESLLIHQLRFDECGHERPITPVVVETSVERITLSIANVAFPPRPNGRGIMCSADWPLPTITTVPLGFRPAGQVIGGEGRVPVTVPLRGFGSSVPRVVGLRIPDAVAVLEAADIRKARLRFDGPRRGVVVGQTPGPQWWLRPTSGPMILHTKAR